MFKTFRQHSVILTQLLVIICAYFSKFGKMLQINVIPSYFKFSKQLPSYTKHILVLNIITIFLKLEFLQNQFQTTQCIPYLVPAKCNVRDDLTQKFTWQLQLYLTI